MIREISSKTVLIELLIGCAFYFVVGEAIIIALPVNIIYESIGFITGVIFSAAMLVHMAVSIEKIVDLDEKEALKKTRIAFTLRIVAIIIVFTILIASRMGDAVTAVIGLFSLKVAAYLRPITHKAVKKFM